MDSNKNALVLGATGGVGGSLAAALVARGWHVRAMARDPGKARASGLAGVEWISGDAMVRADVERAAQGVGVIVHAVNPPNYQNWDKLVLPMIDNTIAAARAAGGARVVLPGTIYNFDPATTPLISTNSPQRPHSRKGRVRMALEERLKQAAPDAPALVVRAGDFFGPGARSSWFGQVMVAAGKPVRRIINLARGYGHSWAYLPDLAETFMRLLDHPERLAPFEEVQFEGLYDHDGKRMIEAVRHASGRAAPVYRFPWWLVRALAPFAGFPRELAEMVSYWRYPMRLDNVRLVELIGPEPRTPLDRAMAASLSDMGCVPRADAGAMARHPA